MPEIYEYRGVRGLVAAPITKDDKNEFVTGTPFEVAGVAQIGRSTSSSNEAHYYDNIPAVIITSVGADTVTINASAIPHDVVARLTGQEYVAEKGMYIECEPTPGYFAIGYITENTNGEEIFVWRLKGSFTIPDEEHNTKNDGTDANGQELTYTGISTIHKFTETGKSAKAINVNTAKNPVEEADFFASVQTPDTVAASPNITLNKHSLTVEVGGSETLTASVIPSGSTVTWTSSGTDVTVEDGVVTGAEEGSAVITASITVGGKTYTDTCTVTVTAQN